MPIGLSTMPHRALASCPPKQARPPRFTAFKSATGSVASSGDFTLSIDLDSVDTAIEIRDTRMREMLFETDQFPNATVVRSVDIEQINGLAVGESAKTTTEAQLMVHGANVALTVEMTVARLSESRLLVASEKPLIVNASQVALLEGVERLREVAGLPSISPAVPVTFVLAFDSADLSPTGNDHRASEGVFLRRYPASLSSVAGRRSRNPRLR